MDRLPTRRGGEHYIDTFEEVKLLTEAEVQRTFRKMIASQSDLGPDLLDRAEALLDELRPESPLRHRLGTEIEELRDLTHKRA